jgi:hypothetical protein
MTKTYLGAIILSLFLASCATKGGDTKEPVMLNSGFLENYTILKDEKDAAGNPVRRWVSSKLNAHNYQKVMIEPVIYFPPMKPDATANAATLEAVRRYMDQTLRSKVGAQLPLVDQTGPGVVRMRVAIASVNTEAAALKAYQYIPLAYLVHKVDEAATGTNMATMVFVEAEMTDSVSGELLAEAVKSGDGTTVKEGTSVTAADVTPLIDRWAQLAADLIASRLGGK